MEAGWKGARWPSAGAGSMCRRRQGRRPTRGGALPSWSGADGEPHDDLCSLAHGGEYLDAAVMEVDHPSHQSEPDAGPVGLRRVVHLEDPLDVLRWDARPRVRDGDPERLRLELRRDVDPSPSGHRLTGIDEKVHEGTPQHLLVALDRGQIGLELRGQHHVLSLPLRLEQGSQILQDRIEVHRCAGQVRGIDHLHEAIHHAGRALNLTLEDVEAPDDVRRRAGDALPEEGHSHRHGMKRVLHVVGDLGGDLTEGGELGRVLDEGLEGPRGYRHRPDVPQHEDGAGGARAGDGDRKNRGEELSPLAIPDDLHLGVAGSLPGVDGAPHQVEQRMLPGQDLDERPAFRIFRSRAQKRFDRTVGEEDEAVCLGEEDAVLQVVHGGVHAVDLAPLSEDPRPVRLHLLAEELELIGELAELVACLRSAANVEVTLAQPLHVLRELAYRLDDAFWYTVTLGVALVVALGLSSVTLKPIRKLEGDHEGDAEGESAQDDRVPEGIVEPAPEKGHGDAEADGGQGLAVDVEGEGRLVDLRVGPTEQAPERVIADEIPQARLRRK